MKAFYKMCLVGLLISLVLLVGIFYVLTDNTDIKPNSSLTFSITTKSRQQTTPATSNLSFVMDIIDNQPLNKESKKQLYEQANGGENILLPQLINMTGNKELRSVNLSD